MQNGFLRRSILKLAEDLTEGETKRTICPKCKGGDSSEKSFVVSVRQHKLLYKCFRAKCNISGLVGINTSKGAVKKTYDKRYKDNLSPIPESLWKLKFEKYGLSMDDIATQGISYAEKVNRIRFPIYDYRGYEIGELLRAITNEQKPKALITPFNSVPLIHFPLGQKLDNVLVLVEDQVSAIKVSKVYPCAALMGTNLSDDGLTQLRQLSLTNITLLLDGDEAGINASKVLHNKIAPHTFRTTVIYLERGKDPKDLPLEELKDVLYRSQNV